MVYLVIICYVTVVYVTASCGFVHVSLVIVSFSVFQLFSSCFLLFDKPLKLGGGSVDCFCIFILLVSI